MRFQNPANGHVERNGFGDVLGTLFLGPIWLFIKGAMGAGIAYLIACFLLVIVWPILIIFHFVMAILAPYIVGKAYLHKGWIPVDGDGNRVEL